MSVQRKKYLFFLFDIPSGLNYYVDSGTVQMMGFNDSFDTSLADAPEGWESTTVKFATNTHYFGFNRLFTQPFKFVKDGARILRHLFYTGRGTETPVGMLIMQWDPYTDTYLQYYKGALDLTKFLDFANDGVQVNIMEGGIAQYLKAWEKVQFPIPMDGSLAENIKIFFDGQLVPDTLYYDITPIQIPNTGDPYIIPVSFIDHDGDNFGIVRGDQTLQDVFTETTNYTNTANLLLSSVLPVRVRVKGNITVRPFSGFHPTGFALALQTPKYANANPGSPLHTELLVPSRKQDPTLTTFGGGALFPSRNHQVYLTGQTYYEFDQYIDLAANENLFLVIAQFFEPDAFSINIIGGSFEVSIVTMPKPNTVWGMKLRDVFKLIIQNINQSSAQSGTVYNYRDISTLLDSLPNLAVTCGDAIRMGADPTFANYFKKPQTDPTQPDINNYSNYGPVAKMSLSDLFDNVNAIEGCALGNLKQTGLADAIFIEKKSYVWNKDAITLDLTAYPGGGEVRDLSIAPDEDYLFNEVENGWPSQTYDQKAGKFETNTTVKRKAPVKALAKTLNLVSPWRADPYGIQKLLSGISDTSTTRNSADNDIFNVNIDPTKSFKDFYQATFVSEVPNPTVPANTDIKLIPNVPAQPLAMFNTEGGYFKVGNDAGIFVLSDPALTASSQAVRLVVTGILNAINPPPGAAPDTATIGFYHNGAKIFESVTTVAGVNTPINADTTVLTRVLNYKDCFYATISTSTTGQVTSLNSTLSIGTSGAYLIASGANGSADTGTTGQLIDMPQVTPASIPYVVGSSKVQFGYQYFFYNDIVRNQNFDLSVHAEGFTQGAPGESMEIDIYINGVKQAFALINNGVSPSTQTPFSNDFGPVNRTFQIGDIVFITGSCTNLNAWITKMSITATSTAIDAYRLKRVQYDYLGGIPTYLGNIPGTNTPITAGLLDAFGNYVKDADGNDITGAGAPFNLEDYSPLDMTLKNGDFIRSGVFNQIPGSLQFLSLDKNQYMVRVKNGITYSEYANILISSLDPIIHYPIKIKFTTRVPIPFAQIMSMAVNGHIKVMYNGIAIYVFIDSVSQKSALNEAQEWEGRLSPLNDLSEFLDLNIDGLKFLLMDNYTISAPLTSPLKWVPFAPITDARYDNINMDSALFKDRVKFWADNSDYAQPWLATDTIMPQLFSNGLAPLKIDILDCKGNIVHTWAMTQKATMALQLPRLAYEAAMSMAAIPDGKYYFVVTAGTGGTISRLRSEPVNVRAKWPVRTLLFQYTNTVNKQSTIFENYVPSIRVEGWIKFLRDDDVSTGYADQTQDFDMIDAIPYRVYQLNVGIQGGIPDWLYDTMCRIMLLDTVLINGIQYTKNGTDAKWKSQATEGQPRELISIEIREAKNNDAITVGVDGGLNTNVTVAATVDAAAWGLNNEPQNLVQVNLQNS